MTLVLLYDSHSHLVWQILFDLIITAVASHYWLTAVARVVAGMAAGLLWALLAGYAARMVPEQLRGGQLP